ncbi:nuclear factor 7, ovary-like [Seriola aureovittata]|uniref:nuclear factor 7, ovary-like n=1 Tax=Seriola aureovittata TaxID=2871759 RepID=UPI0024BD6FFE|nr:nuclear factor 7, ovary-like [Seriola aureovittata]
MDAGICLLTEDQFLCPICLDVFTIPVAISCGHTFCKTCITEHWDINTHCQCPVCKQVFYTRPELQVNTLISQIADQLRHEAQQTANSSSSEDVSCDICTETKKKALKSCLVCLSSYCETHLEPHRTESGLKRHQLSDPVENLKVRFCTKHKKPLELFCKVDQRCVCMHCMVLDHKEHDIVPLEEARKDKKMELGKTEANIQMMIELRQMKIHKIKHSVKLSNEDANREKTGGVQIFNFIRNLMERQQKNVTDTIEEKQRTTEEQAKGSIRALKQEILELTKQSAKTVELSYTEDDLDFLQGFLSLKAALPTTDWTKVSIRLPLYEGTVRIAVERLVEQLKETEAQLGEMKDMLSKAELKKVQRYAVDVILNPDTAHPRLILSDDGKEVKHSKIRKNVRDSSDRFSCLYNVLGKRGFSSGRFYYEVQVNANADWDLGVVRKSINRKGKGPLNPKEGYWAIGLMNGEYTSHADSPIELSAKPEKVGVFVDYEQGLVSFYDVDTADCIYSFTGCSFTEKLYPFFSHGGKSSTPLILTPVYYNE